MRTRLGTDMCACTARPRRSARFAPQPPVFVQLAAAHDAHDGHDGDMAGGKPRCGLAGIKTIMEPKPVTSSRFVCRDL